MLGFRVRVGFRFRVRVRVRVRITGVVVRVYGGWYGMENERSLSFFRPPS